MYNLIVMLLFSKYFVLVNFK